MTSTLGMTRTLGAYNQSYMAGPGLGQPSNYTFLADIMARGVFKLFLS